MNVIHKGFCTAQKSQLKYNVNNLQKEDKHELAEDRNRNRVLLKKYTKTEIENRALLLNMPVQNLCIDFVIQGESMDGPSFEKMNNISKTKDNKNSQRSSGSSSPGSN